MLCILVILIVMLLHLPSGECAAGRTIPTHIYNAYNIVIITTHELSHPVHRTPYTAKDLSPC
jgi:hypothetical protein